METYAGGARYPAAVPSKYLPMKSPSLRFVDGAKNNASMCVYDSGMFV